MCVIFRALLAYKAQPTRCGRGEEHSLKVKGHVEQHGIHDKSGEEIGEYHVGVGRPLYQAERHDGP